MCGEVNGKLIDILLLAARVFQQIRSCHFNAVGHGMTSKPRTSSLSNLTIINFKIRFMKFGRINGAVVLIRNIWIWMKKRIRKVSYTVTIRVYANHFFYQNIFYQDDSSAKSCFTWGPAIYNNTVHRHGHKTINIKHRSRYLRHIGIR